MINISYINFWRDPHNRNYLTHFIEHNFGPVKTVTSDDNPDILISSCMGSIDNVQNTKAKCKIFYYGENLNRYAPYNNDKLLYDTFDLIVGFKETNVAKKQVCFPLWLMYYQFYNCTENNNILTHIQSSYVKNINKNKNIFGTILARHDHGGQREKIYNELCKHGVVQSPGKFKRNTQPIGPTHSDKIQYISNGYYNICPENSQYEGYCTEKIFQALEGGTIPLYWGIGLPESEIINENKYCFCNIENVELLEEQIYDAVNNKEKYINGTVFKETAYNQLKKYYNDLKSAIMAFNFNYEIL